MGPFACKSLPPAASAAQDSQPERDMQMSLITGSGRITRCLSLPFACLRSSGRREGSSHLCSGTRSLSNLHLRAIAHAALLTRMKCVSLPDIHGLFRKKMRSRE